MFKSFASIVAIAAISIGCVAKFYPHLFFKVPNVGFILWAMTGGAMPPYIDNVPFQEGNQEWLKDGDVIVSTGAKAGTTWMLFCSHQIRVKGNDDLYPFRDVSLATPWPGLIQNPGETSWKDRYDKMVNTVLPDGKLLRDYWDHPDYPFRIFKSHDVPSGLGSLVGDNSKVKILAMARNGLDTVVSATPFFKGHSDEFRKLWGGFPPAGESDIKIEGKVRLEQMMPGGLFEGFHFGYVNEWWKAKDEKNVLLLHYSDAKKDLRGTVKKLAEFYGVSLTRNELDTVTEKCSFPYMKARTEMFSYMMPQNPSFSGKHIMNHGSMTRNGIVGESKAVFSDEDKEAWAKAEELMFGDDPKKLRWAREGGGW